MRPCGVLRLESFRPTARYVPLLGSSKRRRNARVARSCECDGARAGRQSSPHPPPPPSPSPPIPSHPILAVSPYQDLEKATVLQECRVFHDANIVTQDPRRCCQLITKLLHILTQVCGTHQGEGKDEGREIWREGRKCYNVYADQGHGRGGCDAPGT